MREMPSFRSRPDTRNLVALWINFYFTRFDTVEVDSTFYRCQAIEAVEHTIATVQLSVCGVMCYADECYDWTQSTALAGSLTTGTGTADSVTIPGVTASSHVSLTPTNAAAATMILTAPGV